jgi:GNAT superfamily N-acetyltransferase
MFHVKTMSSEDFPFAVKLANSMDWNMAEEDFDFMLKLEPHGCFILHEDEEPVGVVTCVSYGRTGWFGNLVVKEEHRRKGAGIFLVKHVVDYLRTKQVETVGLYAYQHLIEFYENIGFKARGDFVVLSGKTLPSKAEETFKEANKDDVPALIEFASCCLGDDREKLLKTILLDKGNRCYFSAHNHQILGFVTAKVYEEMAEIGPLLCKRDRADIAATLLRTILRRLSNVKVYACVSAKEKLLLETLEATGLEEKFRVTRMFLGPIPAEKCFYVAESLERG